MKSDLYCEICYLEIKKDDEEVSCPACGENFHKLHLKLWLNKKGICPICRRNIESKVNNQLIDVDLSASEFEDYFVEAKLHPIWEYTSDKDQPLQLETTDDGLLVFPMHSSGEWGFADLQKRLQPGVNTINVYFGYRYDKSGYFSLSGLDKKEHYLWRIGIEGQELFVEIYQSPTQVERTTAGYSKKGEGGFGVKLEPEKGGKQKTELSVIIPEAPHISEHSFASPVEFSKLSFGKYSNQWSNKSKLQIYKYEEYYL